MKKLARDLYISTLSPKEKIQGELRDAQSKLDEIKKSTPLGSQIVAAVNELDRIKQWQFLRSQETRERQIEAQEKIIHELRLESQKEKVALIKSQENKIKTLKQKVEQMLY